MRLDRDERRIAFVMQCVALATFFRLTSDLLTYLILEFLVYLLNVLTFRNLVNVANATHCITKATYLFWKFLSTY